MSSSCIDGQTKDALAHDGLPPLESGVVHAHTPIFAIVNMVFARRLSCFGVDHLASIDTGGGVLGIVMLVDALAVFEPVGSQRAALLHRQGQGHQH